jgi:hypothetical protein
VRYPITIVEKAPTTPYGMPVSANNETLYAAAISR